VIVAAAALLVACAEEPPPPPPEVPRPVKIIEVPPPGASGTREYPGRIKAGQYSEMSFEVKGKVTDFVFTEGSSVKAGAVLAKLDPRDYQARLDSALAKESHARAERDRYKAMYEKDVKPFAEYELKARWFDVRVAEVSEARKAVEDTILRAPFEGVMARKLVEEFEQVRAKQPVLVMQNDDMLEIKVNVPERDLAEGSGRGRSEDQLTAILKPRVMVSSLPGRKFPARLKELANVADPTTRTFEATFLFAKPPDTNILGGMTARVVIDVLAARDRDGVMIPSTAVVSAGASGGGNVWVIDPESMQARAHPVEIGELAGSEIEVHSGLRGGEWIAVSGVHALRDGMTVSRYER
jgi:RND family efflux transporter MFP subunit